MMFKNERGLYHCFRREGFSRWKSLKETVICWVEVYILRV